MEGARFPAGSAGSVPRPRTDEGGFVVAAVVAVGIMAGRMRRACQAANIDTVQRIGWVSIQVEAAADPDRVGLQVASQLRTVVPEPIVEQR